MLPHIPAFELLYAAQPGAPVLAAPWPRTVPAVVTTPRHPVGTVVELRLSVRLAAWVLLCGDLPLHPLGAVEEHARVSPWGRLRAAWAFALACGRRLDPAWLVGLHAVGTPVTVDVIRAFLTDADLRRLRALCQPPYLSPHELALLTGRSVPARAP